MTALIVICALFVAVTIFAGWLLARSGVGDDL